MDQFVSTIIASDVPTLAVIAVFVRNESAISGLSSRIDDCNKRMDTLTKAMNMRFETLTRDMNSRFETLTRRMDAVNTDWRSGPGSICSTTPISPG